MKKHFLAREHSGGACEIRELPIFSHMFRPSSSIDRSIKRCVVLSDISKDIKFVLFCAIGSVFGMCESNIAPFVRT